MFYVSEWLSRKAEEALRLLLETKHLYQSVTLDPESLKSEARASNLIDDKRLDAVIDTALDSQWHPLDEISNQRPVYQRDMEDVNPSVSIYIEFIKSPCLACRQTTPFNLVRAMDMYHDVDRGWQVIRRPEKEQDFVFLFQCQSCRSAPDAFLVRRRGGKLTLCGRAPIERIEVPVHVPKDVARHYSGAIVAFQSGQILAALFLLRVVIEQFTRQAVGAGEDLKADEALSQYVAGLPIEFKSHFPSLKETYRDLSRVIHAAEESTEVFEESLASIVRHFDARRVFQL